MLPLLRVIRSVPLVVPRWASRFSAPRLLSSAVPANPETASAAKAVVKEPETPDEKGRLYSTGRRKTAAARVWIMPGEVQLPIILP